MADNGTYVTIAKQIENNGWTALDGVSGVYYKEYTKGRTDKDLIVFSEFMISGTANSVSGWSNISATTTKINVTAYAVQKDGFVTAKAAWDATYGA